jgi:hypothetical protein
LSNTGDSTYGTGHLILDAVNKGVRKIIVERGSRALLKLVSIEKHLNRECIIWRNKCLSIVQIY